MASPIRITDVEQTDKRIELSSDGEVLQNLNRFKKRLTADLSYLDRVGLGRFQKIFDRSQDDEVPYNKPANVLKRSVYVLGCQMITLGKQDILKQFLQKQAKAHNVAMVSKAAPDVESNPFFWFYHLLLGENRLSQGAKRLVSRDQISKSSRQLVYAHENIVPPEYLIGFILQIGGEPILDLYSKGDRLGWMIAKRVVKEKKVDDF